MQGYRCKAQNLEIKPNIYEAGINILVSAMIVVNVDTVYKCMYNILCIKL